MKTVVELFRGNIAFKLIAGILIFLFANLANLGEGLHSERNGKESLEITFDEKFLEINSIYNDHFLNY
jgi:hypothetical protein